MAKLGVRTVDDWQDVQIVKELPEAKEYHLDYQLFEQSIYR